MLFRCTLFPTTHFSIFLQLLSCFHRICCHFISCRLCALYLRGFVFHLGKCRVYFPRALHFCKSVPNFHGKNACISAMFLLSAFKTNIFLVSLCIYIDIVTGRFLKSPLECFADIFSWLFSAFVFIVILSFFFSIFLQHKSRFAISLAYILTWIFVI